jgi:hypothetical protein
LAELSTSANDILTRRWLVNGRRNEVLWYRLAITRICKPKTILEILINQAGFQILVGRLIRRALPSKLVRRGF